jgi:hypothetical protein
MKLVRENLYNEYLRFTEFGDPIEDLGIGLKSHIKDWLKNLDIKDYRLTKKFSINIYHNVVLSDKNLLEFPAYIKFNHILGGFHCDDNELKDLKGSPYSVSGSFICSLNNLKNLKYGPTVVKGSYAASSNNLISLDGIAEIIGESLYINDNNLKTLEYIPTIIKGDLFIYNNPIETLEYFPNEVQGNIYYTFSHILTEKTIRKRCDVSGAVLEYK